MTEEEEIRLVQECLCTLKRIQTLGLDDILEYGVEPDLFSGGFARKREQEVLAFVGRFPELHIVSIIGETHYNRYIPDADFYYLAKGDRDPDLVACMPPATPSAWKRCLNEILARVGPDPSDPFEQFKIRLFTALSRGADWKDAGVIKKLRA